MPTNLASGDLLPCLLKTFLLESGCGESINVTFEKKWNLMKNIAKGVTPIICEKGFRNHPLTDTQKANNRKKSTVRSRVEHVFGFMEQSMRGLIFRGIGIVRAKANIALTNLVYNMCRYTQILRYNPEWIIA